MTNCGGSGSDLKEALVSTASAPAAQPSANCCHKEQGTVTVQMLGLEVQQGAWDTGWRRLESWLS